MDSFLTGYDDFLILYIVLAIAGVVLNVLFWGGLIYLVWRFVSGGGSPAERGQRLGAVATLLSLFGSRAGAGSAGGSGPIADSMHSMAAREGIDLNRD